MIAADAGVLEIPMARPRTHHLLTSLALAAVALTVGAPVMAACPGMVACPMAAAAAALAVPPPCHAAAPVPEPLQRLAADDCCAGAPPALPVAVHEARAPLAPEAPAALSPGSSAHSAATPAAARAAAPVDTGPPLAGCTRLSLLQTFLI